MPPTQTSILQNRGTASLSLVGALGLIASFLTTLSVFASIADAGASGELVGADLELGYPSSAFALALFMVTLTIGVAGLAGTTLAQPAWAAVAAVLLVGVVFEGWAAYLSFSWPTMILLVLFAVGVAVALARLKNATSHTILGIFLVPASMAGFFAAFRLTVDKIGTSIDPTTAPSCDFNLLVQCGENLKSWQGSLFGFPNPLLGIIGWMAPLVVGILLIAGLRFARWFWIGFTTGIALAMAFVIWLISQSIFDLGTLCPWCMATWSVVIPTFWLVTFYSLKEGHFGLSERTRRFFAGAFTYVPLITLLSYVVVAVIAQLRLDFISYL